MNLVSKLPNFERLDSIGELELMTTYVDPIMTPLFHEPDSHKHFIWSNKQDENTKNLRPDGAVISIPDRSIHLTLGFCEVKPLNSDSDTELAFVDLVRLATFAKDLSKRKENRKSFTVQVIGYNVIIYFIEESFPDVSTMTEVLSLTIPKSICELSGLVAEVNNLKKICNAVDSQCKSQYKHSRPLTTDIDTVAINPKRRKARVPSFSLL